MRQSLGFVAFHLLFAGPGLALLYALGFVRRLREVPAALGPAYLVGVAGTMSLLLGLLTLGAAVRLPLAVGAAGVLTAGLGAAGFVFARRRPAPAGAAKEAEHVRAGLEVWLPRLVIAVMAAFFVIGISAFVELPTVSDDSRIWSYKALALYDLGGTLDQQLYTRSDLGPAHPYYPLLQPLMESIFFRASGRAQLQEFHAVLWILFGSFIWTMLWLARTRALPPFLVVLPAAALAFGTKSHESAATGYADMTVASFAAAGALAVGLWVRDGAARYAVLGGVLLAGAVNTKNEGLMAAVAVLAAAAVFVLVQRRRGWQTWLAAAATTAIGSVPWVLWRSSKDISPENEEPVGASFGRLFDQLDRVPTAVTAIFDNFADSGAWTYLVPCFLVLAVACLIRGVARREAAFYLASAVAMTLGLVYVYASGTVPIDYWLDSSADRTVSSIVCVCGVGVMHLVALLLKERDEPDR